MKLKQLLPGFIGIAILLYILNTLDLEKVGNNILKANYQFLAFAVFTILIGLFLRGFKWRTIIKHYGEAPPLFESIRIFCVGTMIGFLTPLKAGVFIRAAFIKHLGLSKGIATVVIDRAAEILLVAVVAIISIALLELKTEFMLNEKIIMLFSILVVGTLLCLIKRIRVRIINFLKEISSFLNDKKKLGIIFSITPLTFLTTVIGYYFVATALGMEIPLLFLLMVVSITLLIETMPISFLGLGTREAGLIFMLSLIEINAETAVTLSLLYLFLNYGTLSVIGITKFASLRELV